MTTPTFPSLPEASLGILGACVWLTGLSGAGKTTTAQALERALHTHGYRTALFDGDRIRHADASPLGFTKEDRDRQVLRIAAMARDAVHRAEVAICALVSPYASARTAAREVVGPDRFVEVFVDTPLSVCEARDPKGLYAKARQGRLPHFTGIDDPYEAPARPDVVLSTVDRCAEDNARELVQYLVRRGLLEPRDRDRPGAGGTS